MAIDGHGNSLLLLLLASLHSAQLGLWITGGGSPSAPAPTLPAHELAVEEPDVALPSRPDPSSRRRRVEVPPEEEALPVKEPAGPVCPPALECPSHPPEPCPNIAWVLAVAVLASTVAGAVLGCCFIVRFRAAVARAPRRRLLARPAEHNGSPSGASSSESARLRPATVDPRSL